MVRYHIDNVTDEMVLGRSIFSPSGELLLAAGYRVTARYRKRLKEMGYNSILINVEGTEDVIPETVISHHVQKEMTATLNDTVDEMKELVSFQKNAKENVQDLIEGNKKQINNVLSHSHVSQAIEKFIDSILNRPEVVLNLSELDKKKNAFFAHAINVTITALCLGRKFKFSYEEMKQLGIGAINYDIGFVAVPEHILEKNEPLTEDERDMLNQHTVFGHLMLTQSNAIAPTSSIVALQHHEFQDGTGFPRGIKGENRPPVKDLLRGNIIHRFSEIVAVAEVYDTLTNGRKHYFGISRKVSVKNATKRLVELSGTKLNSHIVKTMLSIIPIYPVGARIRISNAPTSRLVNLRGVVAKDNPHHIEHPRIIIYEKPNGTRINPFMIDLAKHKSVTIELLTEE